MYKLDLLEGIPVSNFKNRPENRPQKWPENRPPNWPESIELPPREMGKAEFMGVAKRSVRNMKESVRCFEDLNSEIKDVGLD